MQHDSVVKASLDIASLTVVFGWWVDIVPSIATTLTVCWLVYSFYKEIYIWWNREEK